jgi:hypothetical protein
MGCAASYLLERDDDKPWPSGEWFHCPTATSRVVVLKITPETVIRLTLCEAHHELWSLREAEVKA